MIGLPCGSERKDSACNEKNLGLIPEWGRSSGERNGYPLQYSCLQKPVDRGGLQSAGSQRVGHTTERLTHTHTTDLEEDASNMKDYRHFQTITAIIYVVNLHLDFFVSALTLFSPTQRH